MILNLAHTKLDIIKFSKSMVLECYRLTNGFPGHEKFTLTQQIRRASLSVYLNIAEGCSKSSVADRKRFFQISRGSLVEVDAAFDIAISLGYCFQKDLELLASLMLRNFQMLSAMLKQ